MGNTTVTASVDTNPPPAAAAELSPPLTVIQPSRGWISLDLKELWDYRELLLFLTWRDIKIRYQQTALGAAWAIIQPLLTMIIFSVFFGRLARIPSDGIPYPLFAYTALVPWQFFSFALTESANSLVANERLVTKVYFPKLIIPMARILAGLVDFSLAFIVLIAMMVRYGVRPSPAVITLPFFLAVAVATTLGIGLWLSALNVQYRDVRHTVAFVVQVWMFASPVVYSSRLVPARWRTLYGLNPMAGVIEGFRWALLRNAPVPGMMLAVSVLIVVVVLISGLYYYRRMEKTFADIV